MPKDYSHFFERKDKERETKPAKTEEELVQAEKRAAFSGLRAFWFRIDPKTKIEVAALILVLIVTLSVLIFYFSKSKPGFFQGSSSPVMREELLNP